MINRNFTRCIARLSALVILTVFPAGCAGLYQQPEAVLPTPVPAAAAAPSFAAPAPTPLVPIPGGTVNLTMRPPVTLNPLLNADESVDDALKLVFEPLAKIDGNFRPQPNIADFEFAADGMSAVISLKSGVAWSDGEPVTSADVDYTLSILREAPEDAIYAGNVKNIAAWTVLSDRSVKLTFLSPLGGQFYMFDFPVIPARYYRDNPDADMNPLGDGLYQFESYTARKDMLLVRNENYFGPKPYISTVRFVLTPDRDTALDAFGRGLIDALPAGISDWGRFLGRFRGASAGLDEYDTLDFEFIGFNFENLYIRDKNVREAVCRCVDADAILNDTYLGRARRALAPVNPASWLYEGGARTYPFDLSAAKALMDKAYSGNPVSFRLLVNEENAERRQIASALAANLEQIGVGVDLQVLPFGEFTAKIQAKEFDLFVGGYRLSALPDLGFLFASDAGNGEGNVLSYSDSLTDALLKVTRSAAGDAAFKSDMGALQKRIASELPIISLVFRKSALVSGQNVHGEKKPEFFDVYGGIGEWFVER
ncbi:MAG: peptide ABC transporter substrate-binding protein [Firmicutes bacterium]|nr:peptide ABC transporter substrate-binding protein [Bacillota bacterium]